MQAREVRKGDVIGFGGQPVTVDCIEDSSEPGYLLISGHAHEGIVGSLKFPTNAELIVQRPDRDADLVEIMARDSFERDDSIWRAGSSWARDARLDMRAAIAAARAAGYRIERAS